MAFKTIQVRYHQLDLADRGLAEPCNDIAPRGMHRNSELCTLVQHGVNSVWAPARGVEQGIAGGGPDCQLLSPL